MKARNKYIYILFIFIIFGLGIGSVSQAIPVYEDEHEISPLASIVPLTDNNYGKRSHRPTKITIHHTGGVMNLGQMAEEFQNYQNQKSANYGIDKKGQIGQFVDEQNGAWTSSDIPNDMNAVTIEVSNDADGGEWSISDASFEALIRLCTDICRRNNIPLLYYTGDKEDDASLTIHKMFSPFTECPGPVLESRLHEICRRVNENLARKVEPI